VPSAVEVAVVVVVLVAVRVWVVAMAAAAARWRSLILRCLFGRSMCVTPSSRSGWHVEVCKRTTLSYIHWS